MRKQIWLLGLSVFSSALFAHELETTYCFQRSSRPESHLLKVAFSNSADSLEVTMSEIFTSHFTPKTVWVTHHSGTERVKVNPDSYVVGTGKFIITIPRPVPVIESETPNSTIQFGNSIIEITCTNLD